MSSLSERAMRNVEFNDSWTLLLKVWANPYSDSNPEGVVAMGIAENKLMHEEIVEYLNSHFKVNKKLLTYNDGPTGSVPLRQALSRFINKHFAPHVLNIIQPQHISILSGVGACVDAICFCVANAGDGILVCRPAYVGFESDFKNRAHVEPVWVNVGDHDVTGLEAVSDHEKALLESRKNGREIKALLLCNPHNPLGRCYSKEVLEAYLTLCGKHGIHFISDEVYAKAVFPSKDIPDPLPFTSVLALEIKKFIDPSFVHVLYGMSKDFSSNGLRIGAIISPASTTLHTALSTVASFSWSSSLSDHAWTLILEDEDWHTWYFEKMTRKMTESYERCVAFLKEWRIEYIPANCGPFIWLNLMRYLSNNTWEAERVLAHTMIENGVWVATGESFRSEIPGWFRITFAVPKEEFMFGVERLKKALRLAEEGKAENGGFPVKNDRKPDGSEVDEDEQESLKTIVEGVTKM